MRGKRYDPNKLQQVFDLHNQGLPDREVAQRTGVPKGSLYGIVKRMAKPGIKEAILGRVEPTPEQVVEVLNYLLAIYREWRRKTEELKTALQRINQREFWQVYEDYKKLH